MRLSAVFELPRLPIPIAQAGERVEDETPPAVPKSQPVAPNELPKDPDQIVREIGEWQLEDW